MTTFGVQGFGLRMSIYEVLKRYDTVSIPGCEDSGFEAYVSDFRFRLRDQCQPRSRAAWKSCRGGRWP